ncbi:MAG: DnaJ domain-containing protein [Candidatus Promineifilaceae bacterium]
MAKNYYLILGVADDATQGEIRRAYRRIAKELHPDYYGNEDSTPFLALQEAYAVLGDPERRAAYDRLRGRETARAMRERGTAEPLYRASRPEPLIPEEAYPEPLDDLLLRGSFKTFTPSFDELFDRLWRNYSPQRPEMDPLYSLNVEIVLTPLQALRGGRVRLLVPAQLTCSLCNGRGGLGWFACARCRGTGRVLGDYPVTLTYPPGIVNNHVEQLALDRLGIKNFYLNVIFRVGA